jgi:hypothetical protein
MCLVSRAVQGAVEDEQIRIRRLFDRCQGAGVRAKGGAGSPRLSSRMSAAGTNAGIYLPCTEADHYTVRVDPDTRCTRAG